jgi:hypothetical protein
MKTIKEIVKELKEPHYNPAVIPRVLEAVPLRPQDIDAIASSAKSVALTPQDGWESYPFERRLIEQSGHYTLPFASGVFQTSSGRKSDRSFVSNGMGLMLVNSYLGLQGTIRGVRAHDDSTSYFYLLPKTDYHDLAHTALQMMAEPVTGARLLNYSTPEGFQATLGMGWGSAAHDITMNLLAHGGLQKAEIEAVGKMAKACGNTEMTALLDEHMKQIDQTLGRGGDNKRGL